MTRSVISYAYIFGCWCGLLAAGLSAATPLAVSEPASGIVKLDADAADEDATLDGDEADIAAGHSRHGEAFNEGPRQQAYQMTGTGKISFEVKSAHPEVQKFVEQGIGQLHGFWYFEAERSFRQAAMLDPQCAIAYWGMALANTNNDERGRELIERAFELIDNASDREEMYILALHEFLTGEGKKKEREAAYVKAIEGIVAEFPDDLEAKALLGYALYKYRTSADRSHAEVDVILDQVLAKDKNHPVHHYRIHLWDHKSPQRALDSAALCGPSAGGIAHMWHMCGHIFSRVKRFGDAAWFQEASARVDHRHMMHDRVLPDQIHNFAHNNEWLIRNLMNVGRVRDALDLAKNMIELPRHPNYNTLDKRNSASYGRDRLLNVLERFELWEETVELANGPYLEPTDDREEQQKRLRLLGKAYARLDRVAEAEDCVQQLTQIQQQLDKAEPTMQEVIDDELAEETEQEEEADDGEAETSKEADGAEAEQESAEDKEKKRKQRREKELKKRKRAHERKTKRVQRDIDAVRGEIAWAKDDVEQAAKLLKSADVNGLELARIRSAQGQHEEAVKKAKSYVKSRSQRVQPLAGLVEVAWAAEDRETARDAMVRLRANSHWLDMQSPIFRRLGPIATELGFSSNWKVERPQPDDLGKQPDLASLGPFRWQPAPAPDWLLPDSDGQSHSLRGYRGRPVIMVFYLGFGCLHCAEQLQALAPRMEDFEAAGISVIAVSSDSLDGLLKSQENYDGDRLPFPLVANPSHDIFKAYRAYDDFEDLPLHGTYLIDGQGRIRWQDISYEPFMDIEFLLEESKRLLSQQPRVVTEAE